MVNWINIQTHLSFSLCLSRLKVIGPCQGTKYYVLTIFCVYMFNVCIQITLTLIIIKLNVVMCLIIWNYHHYIQNISNQKYIKMK